LFEFKKKNGFEVKIGEKWDYLDLKKNSKKWRKKFMKVCEWYNSYYFEEKFN